jgi:P27 family predicted phage terminase small subunit
MNDATYPPPEHLDAQARVKWAELFPILEGRGDIDQGVLDALAAYAVAYSQWVAAQAKIAELGPVIKSAAGFAIISPFVTVAAAAERRLKQWATELQLTPKARRKKAADAQPESAVLGILRQLDEQEGKPRGRKATA